MIRKAKIEEVEELNSIIEDAKLLFKSAGSTQWQDLDGYPNIATLKQDISKDNLYVKVLDEKLVGLIAVSKDLEEAYNVIYNGAWLNNNKYYVIHRLAVKKEYYGRGVAKELLLYAEKITLDDCIYNIKVDTMMNNHIMTSLLKKYGYVQCGIIHLTRKAVLEKERLAFQKVLVKQ